MKRKHAVILVHPNPKSFTATMARAYASAARALGDTVVIRDLYGLDFDPRLQLEELPWTEGHETPADILAERKALQDADVFALFYPLWFNAPPAMMKGYIDRVFGMGFGFEPVGGSQAPRLTGRSLISFTSSGAPEHWVRETGAFSALYTLFDNHIATMCGLTVLDHHHFGDIIPGYPKLAVDKAKGDVQAAVRRYFPQLA